jgi:hypothetical protein
MRILAVLAIAAVLSGCTGSKNASLSDPHQDAVRAHDAGDEAHHQAVENHRRIHDQAVREHQETADPTFPVPAPPPTPR